MQVGICLGGFMFLYRIAFLAVLLENADLGSYFGELFCVRDGTMDRKQYYCGTALMLFFVVIFLGIIAIPIIIHNKGHINLSDGQLFRYVAVAIWVFASPFQLSALMRRLNDACMTKWLSAVLVIPFIGNVLAMVIGVLFPSGYGVERYY